MNLTYDLVVIGGGINGAGIACDAAGRGLKVALFEANDLAGATSSASSKLVHGGLRYLEHYEFRLVREALAEREVLLSKAPHIIWPLRFVLPRLGGGRPRWLLRAGLFLYDHLYRRQTIPGSQAIDLRTHRAGAPLRGEARDGFLYWDCWVDDSRLVVLNARAAADRGATIATRTAVTGARPVDGMWQVEVQDDSADAPRQVRARALVNAGGPWVAQVRASIEPAHCAIEERPKLRLVKGSHIVVPRIAGAEDAYLLQNPDGRVIFVLPFEERFSLIGTTDVAYDGDPAAAQIDAEEIDYLLAAVARAFRQPPSKDAIVWSYAGVRPLYDDASSDPSAVTRDYHLAVANGADCPPLLSVYGGKITTYRRLAERALAELATYLPAMAPAWTAHDHLPGGDLGTDFDSFLSTLAARRPRFDPNFLHRLARRHGSLTDEVLGDAKDVQDLGRPVGAGLFEREVAYMKEYEWARRPDDVLWRRTKTGLHLSPQERERAIETLGMLL